MSIDHRLQKFVWNKEVRLNKAHQGFGASFGIGTQRTITAAAVLITLSYCSLLAYQSRVAYNFQESRPGPVQVLSTNSIASVKTQNEIDITKLKSRVLFKIAKESVKTENDVDVSTKQNSIVNSVKINSERLYDLTLDDIFISVKTSKLYQDSRLPIILKTWFQLAPNQTWFFTDTDNSLHQKLTNGHMVNTNCSPTHEIKALCCKMSVEYDTFIESFKKWFCHFDDDNYVNVPQLIKLLKKYNPQTDWYLGRTSIMTPVVVPKIKDGFWFATGGAGFCISRSVALKISAFTGGGKFISTCAKIRLPDDVAMAFVLKRYGGTDLTYIEGFHSHYEQMNLLNPDLFRDQISFSYIKDKEKGWNVINVPGFSSWYDPTRFLSLHCFLFPHELCPR